MTYVYFLVGLIASIIGAIAGIGGGIIIKPTIDFLGHYDVATIAVLSSATVLSMATVSLMTALRTGLKVRVKESVTLTIGSIIGGIIGNFLLEQSLYLFPISNMVTAIQSGLLALVIIFIFILQRKKKERSHKELTNVFLIFIVGMGLGGIASFLGIGGGPLNIPLLMIAFSMGAKEAAVNSIFIIFFSQISSLVMTAATTGFSTFELGMLPYMIIGGISGGYMGRKISRRMKDHHVEKFFHILLFFVLLLNIYNLFHAFI